MSHQHSNEDLRNELKSLADTLEEVLNSSADKSKEEIQSLRAKAESAIKGSRAKLSDAGREIVDNTKEIAGKADNYVRENPWTGIGIGAAVGVVLGVLLAKR
ncbi:DUF883 family protein [Proteus faecis]|uniref:YqjD family protein n=1 Tax=Proteus faecis TaxID=2050967 RepID=A0AAW7CU50_9GAMM|nr:YqjD family protein [Proteus faecis]MBG3014027.1 DUF883 domain-containing protein [Proteus mirabilis]MDO5404174.1 YqjD family protein [Proteus sp. (in: enterobacteria)]QNH66248.1 DUF883 domain-containing protein [Proteus vulgaris]MCT8250637.1 YqjD family protein [Proteus faecis]MDL5168266.1 YqjD family protein [Proteus faecis]